MWELRRYERDDAGMWDAFVRASRNGTFLLERPFMDYHADRFEDCSWMAFRKGKLRGALPANLDKDGVLHSHQGLTYGGWILPPEHVDGAAVLELFETFTGELKKSGIRKLDYKPIPYIYWEQPSQEDEYALFRMGARLTESNLSAAINLSLPVHYNKLRRRTLASAVRQPVILEEAEDCEEFMAMTAACLEERHSTRPVHTAQEIRLLQSRFPERIRMFTAHYAGEKPDAGVMIFDTGRVAHAQYIATTPRGREENLLTPLFNQLITETFSTRNYFDFGISNEDHGLFLNEGLLRQKYSYGATGVTYSRWILDL